MPSPVGDVNPARHAAATGRVQSEQRSMPPLHASLEGPVWPLFALLLGLIVGSFANVCIHRLPLGISIVRPPSACPRCGAPIRSFDNIPLASYALLRGRCRKCQAPISLRYPAVEAANGLAYLVLGLGFGPTPRTGFSMAFFTALLVLGLIDLDHQILPDAVTLPGIAFGVVASLALGGVPGAVTSMASAVGGFLVMWAVASVARWHYGEEALGMGDWKMAAMLGAFLGWQKLLLAVLLGTAVGSLVGAALVLFRGVGGRHKLPLGTFLALGGMAALVAGEPILVWYRERFFGL
jgi:leader peptidase (prepilin peptidase) / N-methyltransferase